MGRMSEETYTFPPVMKELGEVLEETGIRVAYGPNPTPVPEVVSEEAKAAWLNLPLLPLPVNNPKQLAAMRQLTDILDNGVYEDGMWHVSIADDSGVPEEQFAFDQMIVFLKEHLPGN